MSSTLPTISAAGFAEVGAADFSRTQFVGMENLGIMTPAIGANVAQVSSLLGEAASSQLIAEILREHPSYATLSNPNSAQRDNGSALPAPLRAALKPRSSSEPKIG
jgi:hypothetical protein